jgi:hypothetical protein
VGPIMIPTDCTLVQAATQIRDTTSPRRGFYLNSDVWEKINELQKAGLVLHELLLTEAVESGHETSVRTRVLNGKLFTEEFSKKDAAYFHQFLAKEIGFRYADKTTYWMELFDDEGAPRINEYWPNGKPFRIFGRKGAELCIKENCWISTRTIDSVADLYFDRDGNLLSATAETGVFYWNGQSVKVYGQVSFFANGKLAIINLASPLVWKRGNNELELNKMVFFYNTGEIEAFTFQSVIAIPILTDGYSCVMGDSRPNESVSFHRNGVVKEAFIYASCFVRYADGSVGRVQRTRIRFNEKGLAN